jgi:hypothetical protein
MIEVSKKTENQYKGKIIFSYKGKPSADVINGIIQIAGEKIHMIEPDKRLRKKVFRVSVEMLQNSKHQVENPEYLIYPSFLFYLIREPDQYIIISCNRLNDEKASNVLKRIESLVALTAQDMKRTYMEILGNGRFSSKGGAGLGFLEIMRSSEGNFFYEILPSRCPGHKLFFLKTIIHR